MNKNTVFRILKGLFSLAGRMAQSADSDQNVQNAKKRQSDEHSSSRKKGAVQSAAPSGSLKNLALRYQKELCSRRYEYAFSQNGSSLQAVIVPEESGFCHLFSIGSIVKSTNADQSEYSGMKGWNNIMNERITYETLRQADLEEYNYYMREHHMFDQLKQTLEKPMAVIWKPELVPNSRLEADILLYRIFDDQTVHVGISKDRDNSWFIRSYFVRSNGKEKQYPTKYIAGMPKLNTKAKVLSKKA